MKEGYKEFAIQPVLGGLKWMEGDVPTPGGKIHVYMDKHILRVSASKGKGTLYFASKHTPKVSRGQAVRMDKDIYRLNIDSGEEITVHYD